MWASPLRELARRYAKGEIQKPEYQAARREIIESVLGGKSKLAYRDTLLKTPTAPPQEQRLPVKLVAIAGGALLVIAALMLVLIPSGDEADSQATTAGEDVATAEQALPSEGVDLLVGLLDAQSWDDEYLTAFEQQWMALSPEAREAARKDFRMRRVNGRINDELRAQESLLDLGNTDAQQRIDRLEQLRAIIDQG